MRVEMPVTVHLEFDRSETDVLEKAQDIILEIIKNLESNKMELLRATYYEDEMVITRDAIINIADALEYLKQSDITLERGAK